MESDGDRKVERNLQTRRGRESESLFSSGWQRYGRCPAQELKCLRGPRAGAPPSPQVRALTWITSARLAGAVRSCVAKCGCGVQASGWERRDAEQVPPRGRSRPRPQAVLRAPERAFWVQYHDVKRRLNFLPFRGYPLIYPSHSKIYISSPSCKCLRGHILKLSLPIYDSWIGFAERSRVNNLSAAEPP